MEQGVGVALFDDDAAVHDDDRIRDIKGEFHFVGDDNHRPAFCRQCFHGVEHVLHQFGIQCRSRFIKEQQFGTNGKRARYADALLLAAGQLIGIEIGFIRQPYFAEQFVRFLAHIFYGALLHHARPFHDVFQRGFMREEIVLLEDHARFAAQGEDVLFTRFGGKINQQRRAFMEIYPPLLGNFQRVQAAQQRGFPRAGRAENAGDAAFANGEVNAA